MSEELVRAFFDGWNSACGRPTKDDPANLVGAAMHVDVDAAVEYYARG